MGKTDATAIRVGDGNDATAYTIEWKCPECGHRHPKRQADVWDGMRGSIAYECRLDDGYHSAEERRRATRTGICHRLSKRQAMLTPEPFAELLLGIARAAGPAPEKEERNG